MRPSKFEPCRAISAGERKTTSAMIASLVPEGMAARNAPFGQTLARIAHTRSDIVGLTADLAKYTDLHVFAQEHPNKFYQMGMAEQVLMSAAAGLAREGFTPFTTTYAVFASRRAYDFICIAIAEENLNVKIVCALPGLTTGYGPSHQATEDLAIFPRHAQPDNHRSLRRARYRAGNRSDRRPQGACLYAAAARQGPSRSR